jgi:glucose-6-phosphate isomerase, archaeal
MIDLSKQSGLPIQWDPAGKRLVFGEGLEKVNPQPDIRMRSDMAQVLYDSQADGQDELYYMYREVFLTGDEAAIQRKGLRYDITVISPGTLGREFIKTAGHYHPEKPGTGITYPEVYEVLHGRAHYLLQKTDPEHPDQLEAVCLVAAKPGDKVLIPPQFGHITINPGDDYLIMSNWVARAFSSVYAPIFEMGGGAYFELRTEEGPEFIANKRYRSLPPLQRSPVTPVSQFSLITGLPLYQVFQENNSAFEYLVNPESYKAIYDSYTGALTASQ